MKKTILKLRYRILSKKMNRILAAKNFDAVKCEKIRVKYDSVAKAYLATL